MTTNKQPNLNKGQLLKSLIIALLIGSVVLLTAVLPAEFATDVCGAGPGERVQQATGKAPVSSGRLLAADGYRRGASGGFTVRFHEVDVCHCLLHCASSCQSTGNRSNAPNCDLTIAFSGHRKQRR